MTPVRPGNRALATTGWIGVASVALGYLLELVRQRGTCDAGDQSPDTLAISVVLIVVVGGLCGLGGVVATLVRTRRQGWTATTAIRIGLPAALSLAGSLSIFLASSRGPSTWFQYCAT